MAVLIRAVQLEGFVMTTGDNVKGHWLMKYDVDANDGWGDAEFTPNKEEALQFATLAQAFETWKKQSIKRPLRPDGQPNRPLTAFTITFEEV